MFRKTGLATSLAAFVAVFGTPALTQTVTIETVDGNISMQGIIRAFDGENYDFESSIGRTLVPASVVICRGDACPVIDDGSTLNANIAILDEPSRALLSGLMTAFASDNELAVDTAESSFVFTDNEGEEAGEAVVNASTQADAFRSLLQGETQVVFSTAPISDDLAAELVAEGYTDLRAPGRE
ncbi:MAG: hypothetical protein ABJJ20_08955, partial [Lentilitoribacter sp.]